MNLRKTERKTRVLAFVLAFLMIFNIIMQEGVAVRAWADDGNGTSQGPDGGNNDGGTGNGGENGGNTGDEGGAVAKLWGASIAALLPDM